MQSGNKVSLSQIRVHIYQKAGVSFCFPAFLFIASIFTIGYNKQKAIFIIALFCATLQQLIVYISLTISYIILRKK